MLRLLSTVFRAFWLQACCLAMATLMMATTCTPQCNLLFDGSFEGGTGLTSFVAYDGVNNGNLGFSLQVDTTYRGDSAVKWNIGGPGAYFNTFPQPVTLNQGDWYMVNLWMRSDQDSSTVQVKVRPKNGSQTQTDTTLYLRPFWQNYTWYFQASETWTDALVEWLAGYDANQGPYHVYMDYVSLCPYGADPACNLITDGGFDQLTYQDTWSFYDGGIAGSGYVSLTADNVLIGNYSGKIQVNFMSTYGAYLSSSRNRFSIEKDKDYTLTFWAKSELDSVSMRTMVIRGNPYQVKRNYYFRLDTTWRQYSYHFRSDEDVAEDMYLRFILTNHWATQPYAVYLDRINICEGDAPPAKAPGRQSDRLALWLKGDRFDTSNGIKWYDASPQGDSLSTSGSGVDLSALSLNGHPAVTFSAGNTPLTGGNLRLDTVVQNHSIYALLKSAGTSPDGSPLALADNGYRLQESNTQNWRWQGTTPNQSNSPFSSTQWSLISVHSDGNAFEQRQDGTNLQSGSPLQNIAAGSNLVVGARQANGNNDWEGEIAELLVYKKSHTQGERRAIMTYFNIKYGLPVPAGEHRFYSFGNYSTDIAGIGQDTMLQDLQQLTGQALNGILAVSYPSRLKEGDYLVWGHNGQNIKSNTNDLPPGVVNKLNRVWRFNRIGTVGKVRLSFDLGQLPPGDIQPYKRVLLIANNASFQNADVIYGAYDEGQVVSFPLTQIPNGAYVTLGLVQNELLPEAPGRQTNGLALWLKANQGLSGSLATYWYDQSPRNNHAAARSWGPRRFYDEINGYPIARFDEYFDWLQGAFPLDIPVNQHSWYVVAKSDTSVNWRNPIGFQETGYRLEVNGSNKAYSVYGTSPNSLNATDPIASDWQIVSLGADSTLTNLSINGEIKHARQARTALSGSGPYFVGSRNRNNSGWYVGDIAEIIVYNDFHEPQAARAVLSYLSLKYGLTIPVSDHLYYTHDSHPYHLVGVGKDETGQGLWHFNSHSQYPDAAVWLENPSQMEDGEYLVMGVDTTLNAAAKDVPAPWNRRLLRSWKVTETGEVGGIDLSFDLNILGLDLTQT
ncbi:MAG: LamG-like jellyroll fold domain-containing protein, partial [Bacteroidota bacterium]